MTAFAASVTAARAASSRGWAGASTVRSAPRGVSHDGMCTRPPITACVVARPKGLQSRASAARSRLAQPGRQHYICLAIHIPRGQLPARYDARARVRYARHPLSPRPSFGPPSSTSSCSGRSAAYFPYIAVYYRSIGLDLPEIGLLAALNAGVAVVAAPAWGALVDRARDVRGPLAVAGLWSAAAGDVAGGDPRAAPRRDRGRDAGGGLGRPRPDAGQPDDRDRRLRIATDTGGRGRLGRWRSRSARSASGSSSARPGRRACSSSTSRGCS